MASDRPRAMVLKKNLARAIRQGHAWIYRDALGARKFTRHRRAGEQDYRSNAGR